MVPTRRRKPALRFHSKRGEMPCATGVVKLRASTDGATKVLIARVVRVSAASFWW